MKKNVLRRLRVLARTVHRARSIAGKPSTENSVFRKLKCNWPKLTLVERTKIMRPPKVDGPTARPTREAALFTDSMFSNEAARHRAAVAAQPTTARLAEHMGAVAGGLHELAVSAKEASAAMATLTAVIYMPPVSEYVTKLQRSLWRWRCRCGKSQAGSTSRAIATIRAAFHIEHQCPRGGGDKNQNGK